MHTKHSFEPCKHGSRNLTKSTLEDFLFLLESLKKERATTSLKFIHKSLSDLGDIPNGTCIQAFLCAVKSHILSGLEYSRKKASSSGKEIFTVKKIAYTQMFSDYLHSKNVHKLLVNFFWMNIV